MGANRFYKIIRMHLAQCDDSVTMSPMRSWGVLRAKSHGFGLLFLVLFLMPTSSLAESASRSSPAALPAASAPTPAPWRPRWGFLVAGVVVGGALYAWPCAELRRPEVCVPGGPFYAAGHVLVTGESAYGLFDVLFLSSYGVLQLSGPALAAVGLVGHRPQPQRVEVGIVVWPSRGATRLGLAGSW